MNSRFISKLLLNVKLKYKRRTKAEALGPSSNSKQLEGPVRNGKPVRRLNARVYRKGEASKETKGRNRLDVTSIKVLEIQRNG